MVLGARWDEWLPVTDYDIKTVLLRNVQKIDLYSSPDELRANLSNDLCAGLAYLYLDSLPRDLREKVGNSELSPYLKENWTQFREFLLHFVNGMELFVEFSRFKSLSAFKRDQKDVIDLSRSWSSTFVQLIMEYPQSFEIRICYLLGKSFLRLYADFKCDYPISSFYYLTVRPSKLENYTKPSSLMVPDFFRVKGQL
ncbi:hypothetical protein M0208_03515 [Sphingomonas sp. SUN019]|uniref:hypothetical protein n=1 Tax=Sphingomonas sp. SUN019 TaxID=2937788 RepID=UPI002164338D|nr:hypothetical protein [Sphingomonas sp. SUN019]UVO49622.1 hypothetical protein M0208_03515 [Sphingomonas sp. SUN019]